MSRTIRHRSSLDAYVLGRLISRVPNVAMPTLGGRHFWADVTISPRYRIQRHVWTGHYRLLDQRDRRLASGTLAHCRTAAARHFDRPATEGTLVVLLHGLYRSRHSMGRLERRLNEAGWNTAAPHYPSGHADLAELGRWLNRLLNKVDGYDRLVFVTYSLGGLVLRSALAQESSWRNRMPVAGIAQIGTPNRGAQMAGMLRPLPPRNRLSGPAARQLCEPIDLPEPDPEIPMMVIAGGTASRRGFNPFLGGDNDGVVRVVEAGLDRDHTFHLVPTIHGFLIGHPQTELLVRAALANWA